MTELQEKVFAYIKRGTNDEQKTYLAIDAVRMWYLEKGYFSRSYGIENLNPTPTDTTKVVNLKEGQKLNKRRINAGTKATLATLAFIFTLAAAVIATVTFPKLFFFLYLIGAVALILSAFWYMLYTHFKRG